MDENEKKRGKVYIETLNHFRCFFCKKWWSIGDPDAAEKKVNGWYCPWCGKYQECDEEKPQKSK